MKSYSIVNFLNVCLAGALPWNYGPLGHLKVSKSIWNEVVRKGDIVIDATCGNGNDSLYLANLCLNPKEGKLYCIDIQEQAIESTKIKLTSNFPSQDDYEIKYFCQSHAQFPEEIFPGSVSLICYNLGYLPGSNMKTLKTSASSTRLSIRSAIPLLKPAGLLSITSYVGHDGGLEEKEIVEEELKQLSSDDWRVYCHTPLNRPLSPILYLAYRIEKGKKTN